jgi:hypothetical protein
VTVCSQRPATDVIYLDAIGGPAHGAKTIPFALKGGPKTTPDSGDQLDMLAGTTRAIYTWSDFENAYICRYIEDHG